jgi:deoxyribose-phosphate aldolase
MNSLIKNLHQMIDHSVLHPAFGEKELKEGCLLALEHKVAAVFVKPYQVKEACRFLQGMEMKVGTVIGFPHGGSDSNVKRFEAMQALLDGAQELDMVINIGALIHSNTDLVKIDIGGVIDVAHSQAAIVKVILENAYLTDEQKVIGCQLCEEAGADFVKTSTGFAPSGYNAKDVQLMRAHLSPNIGIKAAGGIRTLNAAIEAIKLGCTRIGTSATEAILEEAKKHLPGTDL